jgi:hypothetical protein
MDESKSVSRKNTMKLSERKLKRIIREETKKALEETRNVEVYGGPILFIYASPSTSREVESTVRRELSRTPLDGFFDVTTEGGQVAVTFDEGVRRREVEEVMPRITNATGIRMDKMRLKNVPERKQGISQFLTKNEGRRSNRKKRKFERTIRKQVQNVLQESPIRGQASDMDRDELITQGKQLARRLDKTRLRQRVLGRLGFETAADLLKYMNRMQGLNMEVPQRRFNRDTVRDQLVNVIETMIELMGKEDFFAELLMAASTEDIRNLLSR